MCEAKVYTNGERPQLIMEDVVLLQLEGEAWVLVNLFGERKRVYGQIEKIDFLRHAVYLAGHREEPPLA